MPGSLQEDIGKIVGAIQRVYEQAGDHRAAQLLATSRPRLDVTNYDNWNGGTYQYTLTLSVPPRELAAYSNKSDLDRLEKTLLERIERFTRVYSNEYLEEVVVLPDLDRDEETVPLSAPSFWREGFLRLFISHVSTIKEEAAALSEELGNYGVSGFVAHVDIEPTKEWEDEIRMGLSTCDALAALLTPEFHESRWTDQEVGVAVGRGILVIPVRLGMDPYGFIGRYQGLQGLGTPVVDLAESIFQVTLKHHATQGQMAQALVTLFEMSNSFAEARASAAKLERVVAWDEALVARVRRAVSENDQISKAWDVPEKVERILKKAAIEAGSVVSGE